MLYQKTTLKWGKGGFVSDIMWMIVDSGPPQVTRVITRDKIMIFVHVSYHALSKRGVSTERFENIRLHQKFKF